MSKGTAARELVAGIVGTAVHDGYVIHAEPTSNPGAPSIVIAPARPFRTFTTGCIEAVGLAVTAVLNLSTENVWELMDDLVEELRDALNAADNVVVVSIEDMGTVLNIAGVDHLTARLDVQAFMQ